MKFLFSTTQIKQKWINMIAFWFLGLCTNFGFLVMLSAANDIVDSFDETNTHMNQEKFNNTDRGCSFTSTGVILLANILPSLSIKFVAAFIPLWIHFRVLIILLLQVSSFLVIAFTKIEWTVIFGVILTSLSSGLGEVTFISYASKFNKDTIATWSSGTGVSGLLGSLFYALLLSLGIKYTTTMLILLIIPLIEGLTFWLLLDTPNQVEIKKNMESMKVDIENDTILKNFTEKFLYSFSLMKYIIPLVVIYWSQYFINQGLFQLIFFENSVLDRLSQYRWFIVNYTLGIAISRSLSNIIRIKQIWLLAIIQLFNFIYFFCEVIYSFTPYLWIAYLITFWEGLIGGGAYVNTFYRVSEEIPYNRRKFSMGIVSISDSFGISVAAFMAVPIYKILCKLPKLERMSVF